MSIVEQGLQSLSQKHAHVYAIFCSAYFAHDAIVHNDMATFVEFLPPVIRNAKFFKWHAGIADALKTFCNLCMVDPALVEAYLGVKFEEVAQRV